MVNERRSVPHKMTFFWSVSRHAYHPVVDKNFHGLCDIEGLCAFEIFIFVQATIELSISFPEFLNVFWLCTSLRSKEKTIGRWKKMLSINNGKIHDPIRFIFAMLSSSAGLKFFSESMLGEQVYLVYCENDMNDDTSRRSKPLPFCWHQK